jgi:hypothetical protein
MTSSPTSAGPQGGDPFEVEGGPETPRQAPVSDWLQVVVGLSPGDGRRVARSVDGNSGRASGIGRVKQAIDQPMQLTEEDRWRRFPWWFWQEPSSTPTWPGS